MPSPFDGLKAVLAALAGNRKPLCARLLSGNEVTPFERQYLANLLVPGSAGPLWAKEVRSRSKSLAAARDVIRLSNGYKKRGEIKRAVGVVARTHQCDVRTVRRHIEIARRAWGKDGFEARCRLVRKGKGHKLSLF
jgi:hypothetical protein